MPTLDHVYSAVSLPEIVGLSLTHACDMLAKLRFHHKEGGQMSYNLHTELSCNLAFLTQRL
jgi:hypothetical protein